MSNLSNNSVVKLNKTIGAKSVYHFEIHAMRSAESHKIHFQTQWKSNFLKRDEYIGCVL